MDCKQHHAESDSGIIWVVFPLFIIDKTITDQEKRLYNKIMLKQRVITALWSLPLVIAASWFGEPWFTIIVALWGLLAALEFYRIVATRVPPLTYWGLTWVLLFILSPHFGYYRVVPLLLTSAIILPLIWVILRRWEEAFTGWVWTVAGILFIGWLLSHLVALRGLSAGRDWVLFTLFTTFASDTGAYFVGRSWGRYRLAPSISPKKTWEGAVAGVVAAIAAGLLIVIVLGLPLNYWQASLLSLAVSIFGQFGDLAESLFKRNIGVKESGKLLPGHGGMLDRLDSVVFASVIVYYFVVIASTGCLSYP